MPQESLLSRILGLASKRNYVVGVIDDPARAEAAAEALRLAGFPAADVAVLSADDLDQRVTREGGDKLLASEEGVICVDYNVSAAEGAIVSAYTSTPEQVERARQVLVEHGGHRLKHFANWTITDLTAE